MQRNRKATAKAVSMHNKWWHVANAELIFYKVKPFKNLGSIFATPTVSLKELR